jgi:cytochrome c
MRHTLKRYSKRKLLISSLALAYAMILAACFHNAEILPTRVVPGGDPQQGTQLIREYGCGMCHVIPGVQRAEGTVGPPLIGWADRIYIAGHLPNTPENLVQWIENPQAIEPGTAMPNLGVTEDEARDIAAYLYTLTLKDKRGGNR